MRLLTVVALAFFLGACTKDKPAAPPPAPPPDAASPAEAPSRADAYAAPAPEPGLDSMQQFLVGATKKDLRAAKEALSRGENPLHLCAAVTGGVPKLANVEVPDVQAVVEEATRSCGFEIPLAWAERLVKKMRSAREERPAAVFFVECVEVEMALDGMTQERRTDSRVTGVMRDHAELCPRP